MKKYLNVHANSKPDAIRMDDYSVWICSNIREVEVEDMETGEQRVEYVFDMYRYEKNAYILNLFDQITDTQLALCEIYETLSS